MCGTFESAKWASAGVEAIEMAAAATASSSTHGTPPIQALGIGGPESKPPSGPAVPQDLLLIAADPTSCSVDATPRTLAWVFGSRHTVLRSAFAWTFG